VIVNKHRRKTVLPPQISVIETRLTNKAYQKQKRANSLVLKNESSLGTTMIGTRQILTILFSHSPLNRVKIPCMNKPSALANWTPEQLALGKKWVETWRLAGQDLERIRRKEIRELDTYKTISLLCKSADYTRPPYAPKPWSGLIEQQRWFKKAAGRE
jgi:hypothetical protein